MQTMRTLGDNMAWLLKNIQTGKIPLPEPEEPCPDEFHPVNGQQKAPTARRGLFGRFPASVYGLKIK